MAIRTSYVEALQYGGWIDSMDLLY